MEIEKVRKWIQLCQNAGIGVPEQVIVLDVYARLLEANLVNVKAELLQANKSLHAIVESARRDLASHEAPHAGDCQAGGMRDISEALAEEFRS